MRKRNLRELTSPEKNSIGDDIANKVKSVKDVLQHFQGGQRTLERWTQSRREGIWIHSRSGCPPKIDLEIEKELFNETSKKRISDSDEQFVEKVHDAIKKTCEKRGTNWEREVYRLSRNTVKKIEERNEIVTKNAEVGTQARIDACNDFWNVLI